MRFKGARRSLQVGLTWLGASSLAGGVLFGACARPLAPSGGPVDFIPPMIASTWPDTFEIIEATRDPVKIVFSERISERPTQGSLDAAVVVSPVTAQHRVKRTRSGLEIRVIGGFRPDLVYRVRLLPTIKDLFSNTLQGPFELVFSTGAPFETNVVAGVVKDRITGEAVTGVLVQAREDGMQEPPVYVASSDSLGVFALRYLPAGAYRLSFFQDVNRNARPDYSEIQGEGETVSVGTLSEKADTMILREIGLLRPDTIPARLIRVEAVDSILVRVGFDDYLDAEGPLEGVEIRIAFEEEPELGIERLLWPRQVDSIRAVTDSLAAEERRVAMLDSLRVVADSLVRVIAEMRAAGDTLGVDSVGVSLERVQSRMEPPEPRDEPEPRAPAELPPILPQREFFVRLADSLAPNRVYQVSMTGIVNINGVAGGGGEASFAWEPPEREADTAAVVPDTATSRPDTGVVAPPGSALTPADTSGVPAATAALEPRNRMESHRDSRHLEPLWWFKRPYP